MKDEVDFELREQPLEAGPVEDRSARLALHLPREIGIERRDVERDDRSRAIFRQLIDQAVPDFAGGAGNEDDRFAHDVNRPRVTAAAGHQRQPVDDRHNDREHRGGQTDDGDGHVVDPFWRERIQPPPDEVAPQHAAGVRVVVDPRNQEAEHDARSSPS